MDVDVDDYEAFVARGRKKFRVVIGAILLGLVLLIYLPWALVPGLLKSGVAQTCTLIGVILMFGAWRALLTKVGESPVESPAPGSSNEPQLGVLLAIAGVMVGLNALAGLSLFALGVFERDGLIFSLGFSAVMGGTLVRALLFRGVRSAL